MNRVLAGWKKSMCVLKERTQIMDFQIGLIDLIAMQYEMNWQ